MSQIQKEYGIPKTGLWKGIWVEHEAILQVLKAKGFGDKWIGGSEIF